MDIDPAFAGSRLKDYRCQVTWRQIMNYAAAIGDRNPRYFDDEQGIVAHPMHAVAVTWPISEHISDYIQASDFPLEALMSQVHYTEHLVFHRLIIPEDELTVRGRIAAIEPHRAGTHIVLRFDAVDAAGQAVFTEHIGGMLRGIGCGGEGRGQADIPRVPRADGENTALWVAGIEIDPLLPFIYDGCTDIFFPIHTSVRFAHAVGLPGIILQGTATLALAVRELVEHEADADPRRLKCLACRFSGMVLPGEKITVELDQRRPSDKETDLFFTVRNAAGQKAISHGYARLAGVNG